MSPQKFHTRPTYVLGLGGTGVSVLRRLKQRYSQKFGQLPPTIRLLGIDTDTQDSSLGLDPLTPSEFFHAADFQGGTILNNLADYPRIKAWWQYPPNAINPGFIERGAGAKRPVGRLALFHRFAQIHERLKSAINDPFDRVKQDGYPEKLRGSTVTYVVASLAGGTGTGMFLDIAHVARHILSQSHTAFVNGIFVLPSTFSAQVNEPTAKRHRQNGYAALRELDYFQTRPDSAELPFIEYPELGRVGIRKPPFDWVYLVGNRTEENVLFNDTGAIFDRIGQFIFASIALEVGERGESTLDNWKHANNPESRRYRGSRGIYSAFGVETLETPAFIEDAWAASSALGVAAALIGKRAERDDRRSVERLVEERIARSPLAVVQVLLSGGPKRDELLAPMHARLGAMERPKRPEDAVQVLETVLRQVEIDFAGVTLPTEVRKLGDGLEAWTEDLARSALRAYGFERAREALLNAKATLSSLRQSAPAPVAMVSFEDIRRSIMAAKGLIRSNQATLSRALADAEGWVVQTFQARLAARILGEVSTPLASAEERIDTLLGLLERAQGRLQRAAEEIHKTLGERAARATASARQMLVSRERADAEYDKHGAEIIGRVVEVVRTEFGDAFADLVYGNGAEAAWAQFLLVNIRPIVASARRQHLQRSPEIATRIVRALETCRPLAFYDREEHRKRADQVGRIPAIWLVASDQEGRDIDLAGKLKERGLDQENEMHSRPQLIESGDPDRDDIFIAQHGLFIDTFVEIQQARHSFEELPLDGQKACSLFPHVPAILQHDFFAADGRSIDQRFALACIMGSIRPLGTRFVFDRTVFGRDVVGPDGTDWPDRLQKARAEFEANGFSARIHDWVNSECERLGSNEAFKRTVRAHVTAAQQSLEWPRDLSPTVAEYCGLVEMFVERM
jgi:hypothetical protein